MQQVAFDWKLKVGTYIRVAQEVKLDDSWSEIEFDGWVASVTALPVAGTMLTMDNGETWTVEDGETSVRNSHCMPCTSKGMPAWQRIPSKWIKMDAGWERAPVLPKIEDCNCSACGLYDNQVVPDPRRLGECEVLFVGEAPGYEEARSNPPQFFCGKAGKLLRAVIAQTTLAQRKAGYNNTCVCYASEAPTGEEIRACKGRLMREIRACKPKLVVAIGGVALEALTGLTGITEHQGLLMDWKLDDTTTIKLLPCFHSAAVLRRPELFYAFCEAIYKAALYLDGNTDLDVQLKDITVMRVRGANYYYEGTKDIEIQSIGEVSFEDALAEVSKAEMLYVDLETTDYSPYTSDIICLSMSYKLNGKASRRSFVFPWEVIRAHFGEFKHLLETKPSGYWNGFFDAQFLRQNGIVPLVEHDVMLKQYTLDETPLSQALKGTARRYCNAPDWEAPLKQYLPSRKMSFSEIPKHILFLYAGYDAGYTAVLDDVVTDRMDDDNKRVYSTILIPALNMFLDTCEVGLRVDTSKLSALREELAKKLAELQGQISTLVADDYDRQLSLAATELERLTAKGVDTTEQKALIETLTKRKGAAGGFNPSSIRDARYFIYNVLGIPGDAVTSSTSRTALEDYKGVDGVALLLQYRETKKLLGTYIEGLVDDLIPEGDEKEVKFVVHPNIRLNGTVTGRLSSANPNFFGIPEEKGGIKKLYEARYEGWGIGNGDGAQMEVRVLGALSNDRRMIQDFVTGIDFHGAARDRLFHRGFAKSNYNHQEVLDAKTAVFGPIYGRGAESLAQQFYHSELATLKASSDKRDQEQAKRFPTWESLPGLERGNRIRQAQDHIDKLWEPYPTALAWLKANVAKGQEDGELRSFYGRVRHWGMITDETMEDIKTQGRNFPVQSPSSDTNLLVMHGSYKKFPRDIYLPIFPVHDSVVFMFKHGVEKQLIPELKGYFEKRAQELLRTDMVFTYEFSIGPNWGDQENWTGGNGNGH